MALYLNNFAPDGYYASAAFVSSFDLVTDAASVIWGTLDVYVTIQSGGTTESEGYAIENGIGQTGYSVVITSTSILGQPGYHVEIDPDSDIYGKYIIIEISAQDSSSASGYFVKDLFTSNYIATLGTTCIADSSTPSVPDALTGFSFSNKDNNVLFQINDGNEPFITNRSPVVNSTTALISTNVQFSLHDFGGEGINLTSLNVWIAGAQAIEDGAFVSGFSGTIAGEVIDNYDAFTVVINPDANFLYGTWIDVRVRVSDAIDDPATVNTLDTTYQFRTEPYIDTLSPSVIPTQPPFGLALDACIEFDWLDDPGGFGPDFNTLGVTLRREITIDCITSIRDDIAVVNGIAASGYTLYSESITIGTRIGYHITICPEVPFNESEIITVIVTGDDMVGNHGVDSFNISTAEITPPTVLNFNPDDGDVGVDPITNIYFEMHDSAGSGVWIPYLSVTVDNEYAILNGIAQAGYSFSYVNDRIIDFGLDFDGYKFTIDKDFPFDSGKLINITIDGYDAYGNRADLVDYSFSIAPDVTPPTITTTPSDGDTGVSRNQPVTVSFNDILGVDYNSINISISGTTAVEDGEIILPYSGTIIPGNISHPIVDGYTYVLYSPDIYDFNELITINASAKDRFDNLGSINSSFRVFNDTSGPSITGVYPRDMQREVSLDQIIGFTLRDGYDVNFDKTEVIVNGEHAVKDGLPEFGYSINTSRISGGIEGVDPGDGYIVELTKTAGFDYNEEILVTIRGYDRSQSNITTRTYTWYTVAPNPPIFSTEIADGQTDVVLDTNFNFDILSDGYGVDINTLLFKIDNKTIIENGINQDTASYQVTIQAVGDGYSVSVNPRYLLESNKEYQFYARAGEAFSGNTAVDTFNFSTGNPIENPKTLYIGTSNGVSSLLEEGIVGNSTPTALIDGYCVHDLSSRVINEVNRLAVATRDHGAFVYSTNYSNWPTVFYSYGDEIGHVHISDKNNGTIYIDNRTKKRIDVYYNVLADDIGRNTPDVYYPGADGYAVDGLTDGYYTDMVVTEGTSSVDSDSSTIFVATSSGVFKIDTDESIPGISEGAREISSYGIVGSGNDYEVISGTSSWVVAIDVNTRLNYLYVATRGDGENTISYIDLTTNSNTGFIPEDRLISRLINDISFGD